jgi:nucleoside permease NupC
MCFQGMPLLIYLGAVMAVLYYYGLTQWAACKVGWFMQITMGTTAIETLNVAANIFLDGVSPLLSFISTVTHFFFEFSGVIISSLR